jgi:Cd2+/Zn2+-exporting ATPase
VDVASLRAVPGRGVEAWRTDSGEVLVLGNPDWIRQLGLTLDEETLAAISGEGRSVVVLSQGDEVIGMLAFSDTIRPWAAEAIANLGSSRRTLLLSGDSKASAKAVANVVGIDEVYAPLLPNEKLDMIRLLRADGHTVAMVGDGVNDAPSLAEADVGIAMGAIGSDVAMETADVVLMRDDIGLVPASTALARRAMGVIRQNIMAAVSIKVALAVLVFMGLATLWMAVAIGDMGASLVVILNAIRLAGSRSADEDMPASDRGGSIASTVEPSVSS